MGNFLSPAGQSLSALGERQAAVTRFIDEHVTAPNRLPDVFPHGNSAITADAETVAGGILFARTVGPLQQEAIVVWAELGAVAFCEFDDGGTTAPALPVMVAAMLRRPALEAYLEHASTVPIGGLMPLSATLTRMSEAERNAAATNPAAAAPHITELLATAKNAPRRIGEIHPDVFRLLAAHGDLAAALAAVPILPPRRLDPDGAPDTFVPATGGVAVLKAPADSVLTNVRPHRLTDVGLQICAAGRCGYITTLVAAHAAMGNGGRHLGEAVRALALAVLARVRTAEMSGNVWSGRYPCAEARNALIAATGDPGWAGVVDCLYTLDSVDPADVMPRLAANVAALTAAAAAMSPRSRTLGDAATLLRRLRASAAGHGVTPLPALVSVGSHLEAHALSFAAAGAPDVAAALIATMPGRHAAGIGLDELRFVLRQLNLFETRTKMVRHGTTDRTSEIRATYDDQAFASSHELVIPAWHDGGEAAVRSAVAVDGAAAWDPAAHVLFKGAEHQESRAPFGAPATADRTAFAAKWMRLTGGVLEEWPFWRYTVAVGGAVAHCLDHSQGGDGGDSRCPVADVDLLFHSVKPVGAETLCLELQEHCLKVAADRGLGEAGVAILLTTRTMTIIFDDPALPRIQVTQGFWESAVDALQTADVDACCCGYVGQGNVVMTGRGALAWALRANVPTAARHVVRKSPVYELRLWKYAQRHGFAVFDVEHLNDNAALQERYSTRIRGSCDGILQGDGEAPNNRAQRRRKAREIATSSTALEWLMFVDAGVLQPTLPRDDLSITPTRNLAAVLERVTRAGYVESDNYGTHEEGYVVVDLTTGPPSDSVRFGDQARLSYSLLPDDVADDDAAAIAEDFAETDDGYYLAYDPSQRHTLTTTLCCKDVDVVDAQAIADAIEKREWCFQQTEETQQRRA